MTTLFLILLASAAYFAVMSRERESIAEAIDAEGIGQLVIEIEPDESGFHAVIIDISDDAVLHVSSSYAAAEGAQRAGRLWIDAND